MLKTALGPQAEEGFWPLVPTGLGLIRNGGTVSAPPLGGQDRALGFGASWYMEDASALVPVVLGTGPKPHGPLFREAYGASGHCPLLSGKSGVMGGLGASSGFGLLPIGGPGLAPVTVTRTALAGLSGADGIREEREGARAGFVFSWEGLEWGAPECWPGLSGRGKMARFGGINSDSSFPPS